MSQNSKNKKRDGVSSSSILLCCQVILTSILMLQLNYISSKNTAILHQLEILNKTFSTLGGI